MTTITVVYGDIFASDCQALVNPVNCMGVCGAGLALQFKSRFLDNFHDYRCACESGALKIGNVYTFDRGAEHKNRFIINFPTKQHWKNGSKIEFIREGLRALVGELEWLQAESVAIPALGCGLGGLGWEEVREEISAAFLAPEATWGGEVVLFPPFDPHERGRTYWEGMPT